jgi:hypothetical protein
MGVRVEGEFFLDSIYSINKRATLTANRYEPIGSNRDKEYKPLSFGINKRKERRL